MERQRERRRAKETLLDWRPSEILPGALYLGSNDAAKDRDMLRSLAVTHILTVARGLHPRFREELVYLLLEVDDWLGEDLLSYMDEATSFIHDAISQGGVVLVHCAAGVSRSATMVIAYLMRFQGMTYDEARNHTRNARPCIEPRCNFMRQLRLYESLGCCLNYYEYYLWQLECFAKESLPRTMSIALQGLSPRLYLREELVERLEMPKEERKEFWAEMFCCKECDADLFTRLNLLKMSHERTTNETQIWCNAVQLLSIHDDDSGNEVGVKNSKEEPSETRTDGAEEDSLQTIDKADNPQQKTSEKEEEKVEEISGEGFLFVEVMDWMHNVHEQSGSITCASCGSVLGDYDWEGKSVFFLPSSSSRSSSTERMCTVKRLFKPMFRISLSQVLLRHWPSHHNTP
ncbi:Dual specificity phosphatase 14 [Balamuthia mandrillaris]